MEEALKPSGWLVGQAYSIADIAAVPFVKRIDEEIAPDQVSEKHHPRVAEWWARIQARPAFERANIGPFVDHLLLTESATKMLDVIKNNEKSFADGKILKSVTEGVGVVTFNNPEKRNAMSLDMWEGLGQALTELRDDDAGARRGAGRRRRQGLRLGRRHQPVREDPPQRGGLGRIFQAQRGAARAARQLPEADHLLHPRLLPRRRHAGRDADRYPHRRRGQPVRHPRGQARHRLWL